MADAAQWFASGLDHHRAGRLDEAEAAYRESLEIDPQHSDSQYYLATLLFARGNRDEGRLRMQRLVAEHPKFAALHNELGTMQAQSGMPLDAVTSFERAASLDPALWQARYNQGHAYREQKQFAAAANSYRAALTAAGNVPEILLNLGVMQQELGDLAAARSSFERALQSRPDYSEAWTNLGTIFTSEGQDPEALRCQRRAVELNPNNPVAQNNLGAALRRINDLEPAIAAFQAALALDSKYISARLNLANTLEAAGEFVQAAECLRQVQAMTPLDALEIKRAFLLPLLAESVEQIDDTRRQMATALDALAARRLVVNDPATLIGVPCFPLAYLGHNERATQIRIADLIAAATPGLAYVADHCQARTRSAGGRMRIGFLSDHLREHTVGKLNRGVIERLDRERFEVICLQFPRPADPTATAIARAADANVTLATSLEQAREQIAAERLDILFYTDIGLEPLTYYLAHARLAPVQCVTWGHPLTTGIRTIDYFISSAHLETDSANDHYSEQLVRLPHVANYYHRPDAPSTKSRGEFGLSDGDHLYVSPQSLFKFHPDEDPLWAEILRRDPEGTLGLLAGQAANWTKLLQTRFARTMPDVADRVVFLPRQGTVDFSRLLELADVMLDPLHFGGGDTSYQAFAMGTPIVTLPGPFLRSRITYALYRAMGVDDCIATSREDYIERALRLTNDPAYRNSVSRKILAASDRIFENDAGVRELADFLEKAVKRARG